MGFWVWKGIPCWSCKIFSMHSTNVQIMNWKHDGWIWWGSSYVGSVPRILKSQVTHLTTSNWSRWKIMMHQVRLWVNWCIFLHQVRVCAAAVGSREKKHSALDQAVGQLEDLHVPGQAVGQLNDILFPVKLWKSWYTLSVPGQVVGQLKDGSVLGQLVGELRVIFLCQFRLQSSRRIVLSQVRLRNS